jgi:hypothetical protein
MKAQLQITISDDDSVDVEIKNPAGVNIWMVAGILEKVKVELMLAMPQPEFKEQK